ncbi:acyl transferase [Muricauda sp. JGD-17]|uniref:Acyl transferase n=1 Tax=Flagellimonas ochracea TaxID=2696472 RepID=A0A964WXX4_9FLAO|nr:acyl transferase [Allomuricauda ochracea]NAY92034.1 acyl transferase [Allomuricauda ochracea]
MDLHRIQDVFSISNAAEFNQLAMEIFKFQYRHNSVYQTFCNYLGKSASNVSRIDDVPFLPIQFFKTHKVTSADKEIEAVFESSGTSGTRTSKHYIADLSLYGQSFRKGFERFYGPVDDYCILALLPSYLERQGSSLIYMVNDLVQRSKHSQSGFYLYDLKVLNKKLIQLEKKQTKTLLIGVSFALLDLAERFPLPLKHTTVMETGGMKGRRKELIREELHTILKNAFSTSHVHSEYGMTELLSQAYSKGDGIFHAPPWMRVLVRDPEDPLSTKSYGETGGLNIIDLANVHSCSFIATQDLGKTFSNGSFEVLGRFDHSDIRGCNLMAL